MKNVGFIFSYVLLYIRPSLLVGNEAKSRVLSPNTQACSFLCCRVDLLRNYTAIVLSAFVTAGLFEVTIA